VTTAIPALNELMGLAAIPGRASVLAGQIRAALQPTAAEQHRELFLAAYALLGDIENRTARERLVNALAELDEHYGVESPADLRALEGYAA
jgi:hypothetical protein